MNANNALSFDNLLSPVSISICEIGDDDDAFSRSNICRSSSCSPGGDGVGDGFFLPSSFATSGEALFSGDCVTSENRVSC